MCQKTVVNAEDTVVVVKKMAKNKHYTHYILVIQQTNKYIHNISGELESDKSGGKDREGFCEAIFESGFELWEEICCADVKLRKQGVE